MVFSKLGTKVLDKLIKSGTRSFYTLKNTSKKAEEFKKIPKLTDQEKAQKCWDQTNGNCAPFRYGQINEPLCRLCPGNPPIIK